MKTDQNNKTVFFQWKTDGRYFEKKPSVYFRFLIILGFLLSILLYFFSEFLLILLVWVLIFVAYVKAVVPPPLVEYRLTKFGLQYFGINLPYTNISAFTIIEKPEKDILRLFITFPSESELYVVLPEEGLPKQQIIRFLKEKIPYIEKVPKNEVEKIADFLSRITGF